MKCIVAIGLLVILTPVLCQEVRTEAIIQPPRPVGVIYLIQLLNQPEIQANEDNPNIIPENAPYKNSKILKTLNSIEQEKPKREKRSYGSGGGGICHTCGGGGGGYPHGGGGGGFGGGGGASGSWSQSSSSAGSWGGGGGFGKGKYGK